MDPGRQLALLWGGVAAALVALAPWGGTLAAALPACPLLTLVGLPCVTCGATRSALALSTLDVLGALALNPLATAGWIALVVGGLAAGAWGLAGGALRGLDWRPSPAVRLAAVLLVIANWAYVLRVLP